MRILIANRGEIARRIIRTARQLGHETVAVYGDPDRLAAHVADADTAYRLGPASLAESYLDQDRLLEAIVDVGADAVHPGYGFLAENATFARRVVDAGAIWIGPNPHAVAEMGSKIRARQLAVAASVPVIPGYSDSQEPDQLAAAAERIGYPVLVKAAAGGGGKGIRIVHTADDFAAALAEARREAEHNFGDDQMIVERYITRPRHVEVQVVGDKHGTFLHLGTRECSVQRRYQKVFEEAPAPNLPDATRQGLHSAAVQLASTMGYDSAGTVEFIVDDETGEFFFLEMNTRLQVEHPVTEEITGIDLVELMIRAASGEPLGITQDDIAFDGHAFECRVNAEDPARSFAPQIGTIHRIDVGFAPLPGPSASNRGRVRFDAAVTPTDTITPYYDSMIAKLIVWNIDRATALESLRGWLRGTVVTGVVTTLDFHAWLAAQPEIAAGEVTTRFLDETTVPTDPARAVPVAARAWRHATQPRTQAQSAPTRNPFARLQNLRLTPHRPDQPLILATPDGELYEVSDDASDASDSDDTAVAMDCAIDQAGASVRVVIDEYPHRFSVVDKSHAWAASNRRVGAADDDVVAPFPGVVASVEVVAGDVVTAGQPCVVIEAMKMLHTLPAPRAASIAEVNVNVGDQVSTNQVLVAMAPDSDSDPDPSTAQ